MAKTKEQKRTEALARLRDNYYRIDFPQWTRSAPGGESWNFYVRSLLNVSLAVAKYIEATQQLRLKAKAAEIGLSGSWDSNADWDLLKVVEFLSIKDNLVNLYRSFNANCRNENIPVHVHCYASSDDLALVHEITKKVREQQKKAACNAD